MRAWRGRSLRLGAVGAWRRLVGKPCKPRVGGSRKTSVSKVVMSFNERCAAELVDEARSALQADMEADVRLVSLPPALPRASPPDAFREPGSLEKRPQPVF